MDPAAGSQHLLDRVLAGQEHAAAADSHDLFPVISFDDRRKRMMPALATAMSSRPYCSMATLIIRRESSGFDTSAVTTATSSVTPTTESGSADKAVSVDISENKTSPLACKQFCGRTAYPGRRTRHDSTLSEQAPRTPPVDNAITAGFSNMAIPTLLKLSLHRLRWFSHSPPPHAGLEAS